MSERGLETSKNNYVRGADYLRLISEEVAEMHVPEETIARWRTLLGAIRVVDHQLDSIRNRGERLAFSERVMAILNGAEGDFDESLGKSLRDVRQLAQDLPGDQKEFFLRNLSLILKVTEDIKDERQVSSFARLTRLEGQLTSKIFLPFLPEEFRGSDRYHMLVSTLARLGRVANTVDTIIDLPTDAKKEQTKIAPSLLNRAILMGAILVDGKNFLRGTGISMGVVRTAARATRATLEKNSEK